MFPINIFALTRITDAKLLSKLERQMSHRDQFLPIKEWEIEGLKKFSEHLFSINEDTADFCFFYSFQIPKLGKEFDLLRISDDLVINIELKSGNVSKETIQKQLLLNQYYLSSLEKNIHSYTYISNEDRLYRLSNSEHLIEGDWNKLYEDFTNQSFPYSSSIEDLFLEERYLISPLTHPDRFLNKDYFLTSQQRDIRNHIIQNIQERSTYFQGFTGLPGTGKTLLLYDLAMTLSEKQQVCVLHFGSYPTELMQLNERLKRIAFLPMKQVLSAYNSYVMLTHDSISNILQDLSSYSAILIDEAHHMPLTFLNILVDFLIDSMVPVLFSYDIEDAICIEERSTPIQTALQKLPNYQEYRLTNRIRMNSELSSFIHSLLQPRHYYHKQPYPSVEVLFANTESEALILLQLLSLHQYVYIKNDSLTCNLSYMEANDATCREFDQIVTVLDATFYYDQNASLRSTVSDRVRNLYHGLNRAKKRVALVILSNPALLETVLSLLQHESRKQKPF